jgi:peptide/nickel transport system ATP-binding protein
MNLTGEYASDAAEHGGPLLKVDGLTTSFRTRAGNVEAVNDVSFEIEAGQVLGVVGESGSGKSVTARSIMRMVKAPGRIESGTVLLNGKDILDLSEAQVRRIRGRDIAMVFQDPQAALNPVMRIGDQITEALVVHGVSRKNARARALELLAQVGIPDVSRTIDQYPHEFSGGMRQRVVIAIALANKPSLLIADEPTTALDVTIQAQILQLLVDLRREIGIAIMMITHDMGVVAEVCDKVIVMYGGRVVERGSVQDIFIKPRHPYTAALLEAVPRADTAGTELHSIPGSPPDPANLPRGCAFAERCSVAIEKCLTDRPPLIEVAPGRESACWVSAEGGPIWVAPRSVERRGASDTGSPNPILKVTDLRTDVGSRRKAFFGKGNPVYAVNGVSLEVRGGETLGLVGESGCGKSTLSRTIVGINPAASGTIEVAGQDVTAMGRDQLRIVTSSIQYIFQDPFASLNPRRTIGQSLEEALAVAGLTGGAALTRSRQLMERVGLQENYLDRYPSAFSGGQRQRIGIARALAAEPKILICDEPVSALDVSVQAQVMNLLEELRDELGLGYLFIAHDLTVVRYLSDRVAVMYLGRIVESGTAEQVYGAPQHPYTAALMSSTPEPTLAESSRERIILRGDMPSPANPPSGCPFRSRCPIGPLFNPEREICVMTRPELTLTLAGQTAACHFAGELSDITKSLAVHA